MTSLPFWARWRLRYEAKRRIRRWLAQHLLSDEIDDPVFIIGCGRSGTTLLGRLLGKHPDVVYLNEPRHLWAAAFPESDIWSYWVRRSGRARLIYTGADAVDPGRAIIRRLFARELRRGKGRLLIEKLPINTFRGPFLAALFPKARFIHIHRNGLEVARSIARLADQGEWYINDGQKWDLLVEAARAHPTTANLPAQCTTSELQGLLEWRLSEEHACRFFAQLPANQWIELSYARLMEDPIGVMRRIYQFLGLEASERFLEASTREVGRKHPAIQAPPTETQRRIGGPLLVPSMDPEVSLTEAYISLAAS